ncbi:hypothetical protein [Halomonas ventosae]|uniref:Uncharacterized protein n=1 Tax=Halomonas ventosae TaxID=229007 RepID=A0A2T0VPQ2_9GAMM|nr:hypothetical protein [Halomonas ventosae]PRY72290.1 hypothetical protein BCL64_104109 [Halomonas ventosae]
MARRLSIPGLINLLEVSDAREIRQLDGEPRLDRHLAPGGGLINRWRLARLRQAFVFDGEPLPALLAREAQGRASRHAELGRRLDAYAEASAWHRDPAFKTLVEAVAGQAEAETLGPAAQGLLGRLFRDDYRADEASYAAARLLDAYPRINVLRALGQRVTGRLRHARRLLAERAGGEPLALHATGIAVHNLVASLAAMRELYATPQARGLSLSAVLGRTLAAPETLLRRVRTPLSTPCAPRRLEPGDLVVLRLAVAARGSGDRELAFMGESWARCPARGFILALLAAVWEQAMAVRQGGQGA